MTVKEAIEAIVTWSNLEIMDGGRKGVCSFCEATESKSHKGKNKNFTRIFNKVSWFRGDDEYLGKACFPCLKAIEKGLKI